MGKTTRAVGLAVRAAGAGLRVDFVQFMKSGDSGETAVFESLPNLRYFCPGKHPFILSRGPDAVHFEHAGLAFSHAMDVIASGTDLLVCDEILNTTIFKLLEKEQILDIMAGCRGKIELVMTGRAGLPEIIDAADYVTEFVQRKHPYYTGARARKGIEY